MKSTARSLLLLLLIHSLLLLPATAVSAGEGSRCNGSIAECSADEIEMLMESEVSRRFLEERKHISTGALKRDEPVCNSGGPGKPYTRSCVPEPSNPHDRGCSSYYRCRDDQ
nr:protein RALF-like 32 [Ipomoea batatas]